MTAFLLEHAWVDGRVQDTVRVEIEHGRITSVVPDATETGVPLRGLTLPGLANTHSHAFHRALRGRTQTDRGTFWTWRDQMYAVAGRLDPDTYYELARATYAEMVAAGFTAVGEFHYLHHQPDGTPYDDPNAMGNALLAAARDAGIRITLLDTLYLSSGFGAAPEGVQRRFSDGSAEAWHERVSALAPLTGADALIGVAAHSVRAVPAESLKAFAPYVEGGVPVHVHLSEQVKENADCVAAHGVTPTRLLADHGFLGPMTSAVHATHLTDEDIRLLGEARAFASFCPTTERDLGDGIGPARPLQEAGSILTLGSDSHAIVDAFEEMRAVEMNERLASQARGHWTAAELLLAGTADGHRSLGFADAGEIAVGQRADLVTIDLASPRTAGTGGDEHTVVFAASGADVTHVVVDGKVVFEGNHDQVGRSLADAIGRVWNQ
jgi:formiminoglutamate deiminase